MGKEKGVGALKLLVGLMVVVYGGVLVKDGKLSLSISFLWWVMVLVFFFGMISGLWIGDVPLKILYPQLFLCSANKEACISKVLSPSVGDNDKVWRSGFHREFNDWELAASYSFLHFIQSRIPRGGGCDRLCWDLNGSGKFDTRSFYHKIRNAAPSTFPWKGIWKVKVPKMVTFFMWTATHGQILTLDNLLFVVAFWLIVVICAVTMRNLWIIYYFSVR